MSETSKVNERAVCFLVAIIAVVTFGTPARGEEKPLPGTLRTMNPRALGLGSAMRAASSASTSSVYLNPALMSASQIFHFEGMYQYTGEERMNMGGAAVVDSVTTVIAAGLSFNYSGIDYARTKHKSLDGRLSLSGGIANVFFVGATGRYYILEQNRTKKEWGPVGPPALNASGSQQVDGMTFDAGAALKLGSVVTLGVVGYNLTNTGSVFAPIQLGSGLSLSLFDMLIIEGDVLTDFTSHKETGIELDLGAEVFLASVVSLRAGYIYDIYYNIHSPTAGLGYVHPKFAVDFGFMREIREDGRTLISLGFKFFINQLM